MPNNDYKMLWNASKFDWKEIKKRFTDKIPNEDMQRVNRK